MGLWISQKVCIRLLLIHCYTIDASVQVEIGPGPVSRSNQSSLFLFNRSRSPYGSDGFLSFPVFHPVRSFSTSAFKKKSVQIKRIGPGPVIGLRKWPQPWSRSRCTKRIYMLHLLKTRNVRMMWPYLPSRYLTLSWTIFSWPFLALGASWLIAQMFCASFC